MTSDKLQLSLINSVKLRNPLDESQFPQDQAGFVKSGKYAWIVDGASIEIVSTDNGNKVGHYNFNKHHSARECIITHVEEIDVFPGVCLIAIAVDFTVRGPSIGMLSILHVQGSKILGSMDFCEQITCIRYLPVSACDKSVLRHFSGALAIGTNQGKLFLIDLMIPKAAHEINSLPNYESEICACMNVLANMEQEEIKVKHQNLRSAEAKFNEKTFFSIQLEVLNDSGAILSMLVMPNLYTMAVGLNDGRMVLYDLVDLSAFHLAYPPSDPAPLTHMSFLEPTDDPRCAVYIWSFHCSAEGAIAVMHSLMFASKIEGMYEDFRSCCVKLTMPIFEKNTFPTCCQSITRHLTQDDEDILTLNVLAWVAASSRTTNILIFDLNQWYKEEMPDRGEWKKELKYAACFELQNCTGLHAQVNANSVYPFNSIMRPEEHFYPTSLSFDLCLLESRQITQYRWVGLQNIVLQQFNVLGPQIVYDPQRFFEELLDASIYPQFSEAQHYDKSAVIDQKREFLLSVALEYNFVGFLRRCANAWADGSYLGKDTSAGIGLSTLTDWIWNRVRSIKEVCNKLSQPLFDFSEQRIDYGTQKQLSHCCKQLKILSDLLLSILRDYNAYIPPPIQDQLKIQSESIRMASDYQEILQWLLNVGLLPEGHYREDDNMRNDFPMDDDEFLIVPYPYEAISAHYKSQRLKLNRAEDESFLFIDSFIAKECSCDRIYEMWNESYPPRSIQSLLRILLIPDTPIQSKYVIFVYLFMDITKVLSDTAYASIVRNLIKFPAVFKMDPAIIKRTQAFWNLDNGKLETAVEELISPLSHDKHIPLWQRELLIQVLLRHGENSLALRALRCPGNQFRPELEMSTLLENNLLSEALRVQRATADKELLVKFFAKVLHSPNYEQLLDMRLTEDESTVLRDYLKSLKNSGLLNHLNIHFVFLLQRSKFLDAAHLVDSFNGETSMNMEPPKQVLNAYYASMEPTTRKITSLVYSNDVLAKDLPLPMSVNLIQSRCNATNNFFSKCVESITEASVDGADLPFVGSPKLGIFEYRQPQLAPNQDQVVIDLNDNGKRKTVNEANVILSEEILMNPNSKKRRLNDSIAVPKRKSYMDMQRGNLTLFKDSKPDFNFTSKSPGSSSRTTPERVRTFGNFLCTPVVNKKTPPKRFAEKCPLTPVSILKTRSMRGSLSPGRLSEFGDDNKSVKSITFAAMPDSRDTSFNGSSTNFEDTSAEAFYSPDKSPRLFEGPKSRKPISHSNSPSPMAVDSPKLVESPPDTPKTSPRSFNIASTLIKNLQNISQEVESFEKATNDEKERKIRENESKSSDQILADIEKHSETLNTTVESDGSIAELLQPYQKDVLKDGIDSNSSSNDSESEEQSYVNLTRHSVIESKYGDTSDSQDTENDGDDDEEVHEEHYEEEQLPEHGDDDDSDEDSYDNEVDLNDSSDIADYEDEEEEEMVPKVKSKSEEVICLDSSDEESDSDVEIQPNLPAFTAFSQEPQQPIPVLMNQEEMCDVLYEDMEADGANDEIEIEAPQFEEIVPVISQVQSIAEEVEMPSSSFVDPLEDQNVIQPSENVSQETETFVSAASAGEFNDALMIDTQQIDSTTIKNEVQEELSIVEEPTNVLDQAAIDIDVTPVEVQVEQVEEPANTEEVIESQPTTEEVAIDQEVEELTKRSMRSRSGSTARSTRGQSVPTNASSSPKSTRSTRASTEERDKPPKRRNVKTLEIIEETGTPVASPGMLTRKRSQLSLADSVETPSTPTILTRRRSLLSEEVKSNASTPSTPKRVTRAISKESLASHNESESSAAGLTRRGSLRKRTTSASDNDDAKSTRSTRSTRKSARTPTSSVKSTPEKPSPSSVSSSQPTEETSLTNRRLTRKQMQVVEKSKSLLLNMSQESVKTTTSSVVSGGESDNESVASASSVGSSRASRKRKVVKFKEDEATKATLPAILEESVVNEGPSPSKIRSKRTQRK